MNMLFVFIKRSGALISTVCALFFYLKFAVSFWRLLCYTIIIKLLRGQDI